MKMTDMNDELDTMPDAQLSEVFAVEVAGMEKRHVEADLWHGMETQFATDANAVLPWLPKHWRAEAGILYEPKRDVVIVKVKDGRASAPTFARAACIALIRAARTKKDV
jgi:hypothetical protein